MKIFGIGLSKTGTTSLAHALELLGYKTRDYPGLVHYAPGDLTSIDASLLDAHDAYFIGQAQGTNEARGRERK